MIEDKLDRNERIRLEALNQAVIHMMHQPIRSAPSTIEVARVFEEYIKTGVRP